MKSNDLNKIEQYLKICSNKELINKKYYKKLENPKVSIISPVHNSEKYLTRFINSIQNQIFKEFEMIFIDDSSNDNSIKTIENFQKKDKRIVLIKNKKNRGTFISRNLGVLKSKGEYLILPDPDDILSKDIINTSYNFIKRYNYEMIRFNIYIGKGRLFFNYIVRKLKSCPIYQPELKTYLFYGLGKLKQIDFNVSNKFIKRTSFIEALNLLNKYYLNIYMSILEDGLINFILYRTVKSFYFLNKIGYYYIYNKESITKTKKKLSQNQIIKYKFIYLKIVFEFTKNTLYEKNMFNFVFKLVRNKPSYYIILFLNKDLYFYYNLINRFFNSKFINYKNKIYLKKIKNIIKKKITKKC